MNISLECLWNRWPWLIACALLIYLTATLLTRPEYISRKKRNFFFVLRLLSTAALISAILSPVLKLTWDIDKPPEYLVLVDASASMAVSESNGRRFYPILESIKRGDWTSNIKKRGALLRWMLFGSNVRHITPQDIDSATFSDGATDIGAAFTLTSNDRTTAGIILFSDGAFNSGPEPEQAALSTGIPVYGVAVGDTFQYPDIYIEHIETLPHGNTGSPVKTRIIAGATGRINDSIIVEIRDGKDLLEKKCVYIGSAAGLHEIVLYPVPMNTGERKWKISLRMKTRESNIENNSQSHWIKIGSGKIKVAALFNAPCLDARFIRRAISMDTAIAVVSKTILASNEAGSADKFIQKAVSDSCDVLLLHNIAIDSLSRETVILLKRWTEELGHGLITFGKVLLKSPDSNLNWLPFASPMKLTYPAISSKIENSRWASSSSIIETRDRVPLDAANLIPLPWYDCAPAAGAISILTISTENTNRPLIFWKRSGKGKIMAVLQKSIWQWDFTSDNGPGISISDFFSDWIRWMAVSDAEKRFHITLNRKQFKQGENAHVIAEVYDEALRPLSDATVEFTISDKMRKISRYELRPLAEYPGMYEAGIPLFAGGEFKYSANAVFRSNKIGVLSGEFSVAESPLESGRTAANPFAIKKISEVTGGIFYNTIGDFERRISGDLSYRKTTQTKEMNLSTGGSLWLIVIWILLLSTEWALRKKWQAE